MSEQQAASANPLSEAEEGSLDEFFSSRPPFSEQALRALYAELRRMREKWQAGAGGAAGASVKAKKVPKAKAPPPATDDLWAEDGEKAEEAPK